MAVQKLKVKNYLEHLRRQAVSEIISDECLTAFANVEAQFGDEFINVSGFEVRLGNPECYVDYILTTEEKNIPLVDFTWVEIDYEQFAIDKKIEPIFLSMSPMKMTITRSFGIKFCQDLLANKERVNFVRC